VSAQVTSCEKCGGDFPPGKVKTYSFYRLGKWNLCEPCYLAMEREERRLPFSIEARRLAK
jgi:hypothetical protein